MYRNCLNSRGSFAIYWPNWQLIVPDWLFEVLCPKTDFKSWPLLGQRFSLPGTAQDISLLTRVLEYRFRTEKFEQDYSECEMLKNRYERQTQTQLPDSIMFALLNKTTGPLQQQLRLNVRILECDTLREWSRNTARLTCDQCEQNCEWPSTNRNLCDVAKRKRKDRKRKMASPWLERNRKHERRWQNWPPRKRKR